jgi:hypothetical protein
MRGDPRAVEAKTKSKEAGFFLFFSCSFIVFLFVATVSGVRKVISAASPRLGNTNTTSNKGVETPE